MKSNPDKAGSKGEVLNKLKEMIERDIVVFSQSNKENQYSQGAREEALDILYEVNKLIAEDSNEQN